MSRKIITYAVTLAVLFSVFAFPMVGSALEGDQHRETSQTVTSAEGTEAHAEEADIKNAQEKTEKAVPQLAKTTKVKAKKVDSDTIRLTWAKVKGASGYEVYRYSRKAKTYKKIKTTKANRIKSTDLQADTAYRYKVRAYTSQDSKRYYGKYSNSVKGKTDKSDGQKIVLKAKKKIGAKYRAGAKGPDAFDCSGFVYWVYKNAGIDPKKAVLRTSSAGMYLALKRYTVGTSIHSVKKAKAGDIILFKRGGRYSHAAIYSGKGKIIHAATPRKGVIMQSVKQLHRSGTKVAAIIRVIEH